MYLCEQCGREVYEKYGSGRFCSLSCKNRYVAMHHKYYKKRKISDETKIKLANAGLKGLSVQVDNARRKRKEWLESVLKTGSTEAWLGSYSRFRDRLVEFGYKEWKCDCCGNTEWMGQKIPLEVHHVNGGSNKLDNIQFLCPNCHAQTPNYRWRSHNMKKTMGG